MIRQLINMTLKRSMGSLPHEFTKVQRHIYNRKNLRHDHYLKFPRYFKIIQKFGLENHAARAMIFENKFILDLPEERLLALLQLCHKWKIDTTNLPSNSKLLGSSERDVENRIMVLEEMGMKNIDTEMLVSFHKVMNTRMGVFVAATGIHDMTEKLIEHFGPIPPEAPPLEGLSNSLSCLEYRRKCLRWYWGWRLNVATEEQELLDSIVLQMNHRSFRLVKEQIDFLLNTVGLSGSKILKMLHTFTYFKPEELLRIIEEVKTFGGIELVKLMRINPVLHHMKYDNVIEVLKILKENGFTNKQLRNYPYVLLTPCKQLYESVQYIDEIPELRVLRNNSRVLYLVDRMKIVKARLEYLRYHNIRHVSVHILTGDRLSVEKVFITGIDTTCAREIGFALAPYVNISREVIAQRMRKHPFWRRVDIPSVVETVKYLLTRFTPEDIAENIQIVLYSKEKIADTLKTLPERAERLKKLYPNKSILAYCLYDIEKSFHFSGDGIWRYQPPLPRDEFLREIVEAQLEGSDSEGTDDDEKVTTHTSKVK